MPTEMTEQIETVHGERRSRAVGNRVRRYIFELPGYQQVVLFTVGVLSICLGIVIIAGHFFVHADRDFHIVELVPGLVLILVGMMPVPALTPVPFYFVDKIIELLPSFRKDKK